MELARSTLDITAIRGMRENNGSLLFEFNALIGGWRPMQLTVRKNNVSMTMFPGQFYAVNETAEATDVADTICRQLCVLDQRTLHICAPNMDLHKDCGWLAVERLANWQQFYKRASKVSMGNFSAGGNPHQYAMIKLFLRYFESPAPLSCFISYILTHSVDVLRRHMNADFVEDFTVYPPVFEDLYATSSFTFSHFSLLGGFDPVKTTICTFKYTPDYLRLTTIMFPGQPQEMREDSITDNASLLPHIFNAQLIRLLQHAFPEFEDGRHPHNLANMLIYDPVRYLELTVDNEVTLTPHKTTKHAGEHYDPAEFSLTTIETMDDVEQYVKRV